jgi:hypothetical protein
LSQRMTPLSTLLRRQPWSLKDIKKGQSKRQKQARGPGSYYHGHPMSNF